MRQRRCRLSLLILLIGLWRCVGLAWGAPINILEVGDAPRQELSEYLQILPDRGFEPAQVAKLPAASWRPRKAAAAPTDSGKEIFWLRLRLRNDGSAPVNRLLVSDYPAVNSMSIYRVDQHGNISSAVADIGIDFAFDQRQEWHRRVLDRVRLAPGEAVTLLWRVDSHPLFRFRAALWQPEAFQRHDHDRSVLFGMLYGALLIMAVYNLFLWLALREKHYLFYVLYLLCTGYAIGAEEGHIYQYLAPGETWPKTAILTLVNVLAIATFFLFSAAFLRMRRRQRALYIWMRGLGWLNIALLVLGGIFDQTWAFRAALVATLPFYLVALVAAARLRLRGFIPAGYYLVAILLLVIGVGLYNLTLLGFLPGTDGIEGYNALGTVLMTVFFSLALASKINQLQRDSDAAGAGIASANQEIYRINSELIKARTERAQFEQGAETARQESRAKSEFLATIGHEIRTPMSGVLGMAELLKATELDACQLHYVTVIERSGQTLLEVVSDLMDYATIEAGAMELDIAEFELETLLDDSLAIFTLRAIEKDIDLFAEIGPDIARHLRGDRGKLQQVLLNLLSNAFKHTETGEILLRVSHTERMAVNSVELRFEIIDTGIGLSEAMQAQLFQPFGGELNGPARNRHLGMAISRQLVELMDGEIGVDSSPGHGATFWFTARFLTAQGAGEPSTPLKGRRLLLLASATLTGTALQHTLEGWGADIDTADNQASASALLAEKGHDLLILDHQLPAVTGLQLLTMLRNGRSQDLPPAILLAGANTPYQNSDLKSSGVGIVLEKPITHRPLLEALVRGLGLPRLQAPQNGEKRSNFSHLQVLAVEDNQVNQMVITGLLRQIGVTPQLVEDGLGALEAFHQRSYHVVLMDCEMPNLDGYEATRQLRGLEQREGRSPARIIGVSAHAGSNYRDKAFAAGMDSYLSKPVSADDLTREFAAVDLLRDS